MEFTKARIAKINTDQSVTSVELHYYGGKEEAGKILAEHYTTAEQVDALLAGGNLMSLDPQQAGCSYVHIEMNAEWEECQPKHYRSFASLLNSASATLSNRASTSLNNRADNPEFLYIFNNGRWYYHATIE